MANLVHPAQFVTSDLGWGTLTWLVSGEQGSSETMTLGRCVLRAGQANDRHVHPNCDELLHVLSGRIEHVVGEEVVPMGPGDVLSIPTGVPHWARNVGPDDAELLLCYSSAWREFVPVPEG